MQLGDGLAQPHRGCSHIQQRHPYLVWGGVESLSEPPNRGIADHPGPHHEVAVADAAQHVSDLADWAGDRCGDTPGDKDRSEDADDEHRQPEQQTDTLSVLHRGDYRRAVLGDEEGGDRLALGVPDRFVEHVVGLVADRDFPFWVLPLHGRLDGLRIHVEATGQGRAERLGRGPLFRLLWRRVERHRGAELDAHTLDIPIAQVEAVLDRADVLALVDQWNNGAHADDPDAQGRRCAWAPAPTFPRTLRFPLVDH